MCALGAALTSATFSEAQANLLNCKYHHHPQAWALSGRVELSSPGLSLASVLVRPWWIEHRSLSRRDSVDSLLMSLV